MPRAVTRWTILSQVIALFLAAIAVVPVTLYVHGVLRHFVVPANAPADGLLLVVSFLTAAVVIVVIVAFVLPLAAVSFYASNRIAASYRLRSPLSAIASEAQPTVTTGRSTNINEGAAATSFSKLLTELRSAIELAQFQGNLPTEAVKKFHGQFDGKQQQLRQKLKVERLDRADLNDDLGKDDWKNITLDELALLSLEPSIYQYPGLLIVANTIDGSPAVSFDLGRFVSLITNFEVGDDQLGPLGEEISTWATASIITG